MDAKRHEAEPKSQISVWFTSPTPTTTTTTPTITTTTTTHSGCLSTPPTATRCGKQKRVFTGPHCTAPRGGLSLRRRRRLALCLSHCETQQQLDSSLTAC
ncbi:unnamed protein product [Merluccius merluccius]